MPFLPVHDKNALKFIPFQRVTVTLIAANVLVFLWQLQTGSPWLEGSAGLIPAALMGVAVRPPEIAFVPPEVTLISHMFLHGDWLHLISNMIFLWVFGDNVEDAMGHLKFLIFYLLCGIAGGYVFVLTEPSSEVPMIGASGATSGVIGAYLLLYPRVKVWVLLLLRIPLRLRAYWVLIAWFAFQLYFIISGTDQQTAWWAHIGGFVAGMVLIVFMKRRGVPLFGHGSEASGPASAETTT